MENEERKVMEKRTDMRGTTHSRRIRSRGLPVRLWLVCAILACTIVGVPSWSRYRKQLDGMGNAAIARLAVGSEIQIDAGTLPEKPGDSTRVAFVVINEKAGAVSEAQLQYRVTPETAGNLPLKFTLTRDESQGTADGNWIPTGSIAGNAASTAGILPPGERSVHRYTITIAWPESTEDNADYADEIDYVRIRIRAEQVSPAA